MGEFIIGLVALGVIVLWVFMVVAQVVAGWWSDFGYFWVERRRRRKAPAPPEDPALVRARRERLADTRLWELLHDEDPGWLVAMGISKPEAVKERELNERVRAQERLVRSYKPLTVSGTTFDRDVERQLEARLTERRTVSQEIIEAAEDLQNRGQGMAAGQMILLADHKDRLVRQQWQRMGRGTGSLKRAIRSTCRGGSNST